MKKKFLKVGITGGFGTGKSTVAGMFKELGASVIEADDLARRLLRRGTKEYRRVVKTFGEKILDSRGRIRRRILAGEVFGRPESLSRLNRIVHPPVIRALKNYLARGRGPARIAVIPLLFEAGLAGWFDFIVAVKAGPERVHRRVQAGRRMSAEEVRRREISQLPLEEKLRKADFIIDNDGSLPRTRREVKKVWEELMKSCAG